MVFCGSLDAAHPHWHPSGCTVRPFSWQLLRASRSAAQRIPGSSLPVRTTARTRCCSGTSKWACTTNTPRSAVQTRIIRAFIPASVPSLPQDVKRFFAGAVRVSPLLVPSGAQRVSSEHAVSSLPRAPRLRVDVRGRRAGRPPRGRLHLWLLPALPGYASDVGEECRGE